jgi:electron-transferring-flavoprotein dehydrogenase
MIAAETIYGSLVSGDFSESGLKSYKTAVNESYVGHEMYKARNWHQAFDKGLLRAMIKAGLQYVLGGRIIASRLKTISDHEHLKTVINQYGAESPCESKRGDIKYDGKLTFDKETDVYYSGTTHEESQPPHLKILDMSICLDKCAKDYQNPCVRFCPANVYEVAEKEESGKPEMILNFSNCVHCKTCDIKDPYANILWAPPEGGGGPKYTMM